MNDDDLRVGQVWTWGDAKELAELYLVLEDGLDGGAVELVILYTIWRNRAVGDRMRLDGKDLWFRKNNARIL